MSKRATRERLTYGEGWWLLRRRLNWTQRAMAAHQAISEDRYRAWEKDIDNPPIPSVAGPVRLSLEEWLALARRRRGWTLPSAGAFLGVSRVTVWKAENGRTSSAMSIAASYSTLGRPIGGAGLRLPFLRPEGV